MLKRRVRNSKKRPACRGTGELVGGALAAPYYGCGPYYPGPYCPGPAPAYYGYPPPAPEPGYPPPAPGYATPGYPPSAPGLAVSPCASAGDPVAYCTQRYRSYNPQTGTYLGNDGQRHHGFGAVRVATFALLTLTKLSALRSSGVVIARFSGQAVTLRSSPTVFADTPIPGSTFTRILAGKPPRAKLRAALLLATAQNSFSSICSVTGQPLIPALFSRTQRGCRSACTYRARRLPIEPVPCTRRHTGRQIRSTLLAICFIRATKEGSSGSQGRPNLRSAVCQTWATLCGKSVLERIVERLFLVSTHALVGMVRSTVRFAFRICIHFNFSDVQCISCR